MENSVDTAHVGFVHRASNFYADGRPTDFQDNGKDQGKGQDVAGLEGVAKDCWGEETDYGFVFRDTFEGGAIRVSYFEIPNVLHIKVYPLDAESGWRDFVAWKVPMDDESYRNFNLTIGHVQGEAAERYRAHPQRPSSQRSREAQQRIQSLGDEILAGRLRLDVQDVGDLARSVNLQDYVAQFGQGVIADREQERLGAMDEIVVLLRQLWSREMRKLARGEPLKQWRWPGYLDTTTGA